MLEAESGIAPEVIAARGYYTAATRADVPDLFPPWQRRLGLVIPTFSPDGETRSYQLKPRKRIRRKNGSAPKYETPESAGVTLDANPLMLEEVRRGSGDLWVTEGAKKVDALASWGLPAVGAAGVHMFAVPGTKGTEPLRCWQHVRLKGRTVIIAFDADARTNANVQEALRRLAAMLQRLGAGSVLVVYVPAVNGDTKAGVDDYKAAGGTVEELRAMAAPYEPIDVGAERMARDEQMAAAVAGLQHHADELERAGEFRGTGGRTREALLRTIIAAGPERGKLRASDRGGAAELHVAIDQRTLAERCGVRQQSITKGVRRLEQDGHLERRRGAGPDGTTVYVLTCPRACHMGETGRRRDGEHHREKAGISGEYGPLDTPTGTLLDELARLRWPYVRRVWTPDGYTHEYVARLGKTKGAALRHAIEAGGAIALPELGARMGISPRHAKRHAGALLEAELAYLEGSTLHVAGDALQKLLIARELGSEYEAERLQKERHQRQRAAYRTYRERGETLAPDELERARREKRQARQEATQARRRRRREADKVHRPNYWLWRERQHLRETGAAGYVRDLAKVPEPEESPPPEMPPKVGDVYYHAPECACEWCEDGPESGWQSGRYVRLHKEVR